MQYNIISRGVGCTLRKREPLSIIYANAVCDLQVHKHKAFDILESLDSWAIDYAIEREGAIMRSLSTPKPK